MIRLVIAPHADDETMGCGGLLAKYPDTHVVVLTDSGHERTRELLGAAAALGATGVWSGGRFADGSLTLQMAQAVQFLDDCFGQYRPDEVYLPYPGTHQDHVAAYEAGMRACRQSMNPEHWMPPTVLIYECPTYDLELQEWGLRFSVFEALDEAHVLRKAAAMQVYESQIRKPHAGSPDELVSRARSLGLARGVEYAEQFAPVRIVRH